MILGEFRIGTDLSIGLVAESGDPASVTLTAFLTRSRSSTVFDRHAQAVPLAMTVAPRAAAGQFAAGWNLTVPAAQTALLKPGVYGIDALAVSAGGSTDGTQQTALVRLTQGAA